MKEYDERTPATEKGVVTQITEASQWLERADLLLGQLRNLEGRDDDDPLFLQVKEAEASVLEGYLPQSTRIRDTASWPVSG